MELFLPYLPFIIIYPHPLQPPFNNMAAPMAETYAFPVTEGFSLTLKATGGKWDIYTAKLIIAYIIVSSPMPAREKRVI